MGRYPFRLTSSDGLDKLLRLNREWARHMDQANPELFATNGKGQQPPILWIGCADSRSVDTCLDLLPGEVFVHRNVANMIPYTDPSSESLIQLAMEVVGCRMIIVCGHTDCKGVKTVLDSQKVGGALESWLRNLRDVRAKHHSTLEALQDTREQENKLVELNVIEQVRNVRKNDIVREHMKMRGVEVYGLVYDVASGLLRQIEVPTTEAEKYFHVE